MKAAEILRRQRGREERVQRREADALRRENERLQRSLMQTVERYRQLISYIELLRQWIENQREAPSGRILTGRARGQEDA